MKTQSVIVCVFVLAHVLFAQDGSTNATIRVEDATQNFKAVSDYLALRDASTLNCCFKMRTFPFTSAYGQQLNIAFEGIDRIGLGTRVFNLQNKLHADSFILSFLHAKDI